MHPNETINSDDPYFRIWIGQGFDEDADLCFVILLQVGCLLFDLPVLGLEFWSCDFIFQRNSPLVADREMSITILWHKVELYELL